MTIFNVMYSQRTEEMSSYNIRMDDYWWQLIQDRLKTIEGRINRDHHNTVSPGDRFEITNTSTGEILSGYVSNVREYPSFEDMLTEEGIENVLPGVESIQDGVDIYRSIPGYAKDEIDLGVVAIELDLD